MGFMETFNYYWYECADPRLKGFTLLESPFVVPLMLLSYLYFVNGCGPRYMKNRPAYSLKTFIQCYNIMQIVVNALIVYIIVADDINNINWTCKPIDVERDKNEHQVMVAGKLVILLKFIDLSESAVFVLRKKFDQLTFLHMYHHISTAAIGWIYVRYFCSGMGFFFPFLNCSVHVVMYTYYFASTLGPKIQKRIQPFKRMLTMIQIGQLVTFVVFHFRMKSSSCSVPHIASNILAGNIVINLILFCNFYMKTYIMPKSKTKGSKAK